MNQSTVTERPKTNRRHDLDAVRAFAMLLGIALHASLSFFPTFWPVQDSQQNPAFGLFLSLVHGFRMPLFFIVSGYFTMMLYQQRGLGALLKHRVNRILIPCLLGLVTIMPLMSFVSIRAFENGAKAALKFEPESIFGAIRSNQIDALDRFLEDPEQANKTDEFYGMTPLSLAVLSADLAVIEKLIEKGAKIEEPNLDGNTPIHGAAFLGRDDVMELLLKKGGNPDVRNKDGLNPIASTNADQTTTNFILTILGLPEQNWDDLVLNRSKVRKRLQALLGETPTTPKPVKIEPIRGPYRKWLQSNFWEINLSGTKWHLISTDLFGHLWFLWFLCWLVGIFVVIQGIRGSPRSDSPSPFKQTVLGYSRYLWLLPPTFVLQWLMSYETLQFGPDTATGVIPPPHLLAYYGLFFLFGILYFRADDQEYQLGRNYGLLFSIGFFVAFPIWAATIGFFVAFPIWAATIGQPLWGAFAQSVYVWTISFGVMGLFRDYLKSENKVVRYLSDSSYWLYLAHLPLIIVLQDQVRGWDFPALAKFVSINVVSVLILLLSYQLFVRHTPIGWLLNGRIRPVRIGEAT